VVPNFENIRAEIVTELEESGFRSFARIAHEEFAKVAVPQHHDDAILIHVVAGVGKKWG
jgi:uncharacterized protein (DUF302 family)